MKTRKEFHNRDKEIVWGGPASSLHVQHRLSKRTMHDLGPGRIVPSGRRYLTYASSIVSRRERCGTPGLDSITRHLFDRTMRFSDPAQHCLSKRKMRSPDLRFGRRYLTVGQGDNKSSSEGSPSSIVSRRGRCGTPGLDPITRRLWKRAMHKLILSGFPIIV